MTVQEIADAIERWAPAGLAYAWDRSGLSIGDPSAAVRGVVVALTVTPEAFEFAKRKKAQLIVSHHPLIWEPLRSLRMDDAASRLCVEIAATGLSCYAAHTNLDVVPGGVNNALAERLGLRDTRPLLSVPHASRVKLTTFVPESHLDAVRTALCAAGAGVIGEYTYCSFSSTGTGTYLPGDKAKPYAGKRGVLNRETEHRLEVLAPEHSLAHIVAAMKAVHPYEEPAYDVYRLLGSDPAIGLGLRGQLPRAMKPLAFAEYVRASLDVDHVRLVAGQGVIRSVGVLGGSGGSQLPELPGDIDAFVTGDVKYHDAQIASERGLTVVDAGHAGTEKFIVPALAKRLRAACKGLKIHPFAERELFLAVME